MVRFSFFLYLFSIAACSAGAVPRDSLIVRGPYSYEGLSIYLLDAPSHSTRSYVTLEEALANGTAIIHERNSQTLWIDNLGTTDLFVQSGDLIKGGQQDRMIASDLIVPPHDTSQDLQVYCIEHDRSTKRGDEPLDHFSSSHEMAPVHHLRITAKNTLTGELLTPKLGGITAPNPEQLELLGALRADPRFNVLDDAVQESIWKDVSNVQSSLTSRLRDSVTLNPSPSSLELALEHASVTKKRARYETELENGAQNDAGSVGFAYAIKGRILGADIYNSHKLFLQLWPKLLRAAATEDLVTSGETGVTPSLTEIEDFVHQSMLGKEASVEPNSRTRIVARQSSGTYRFTAFDKAAPTDALHDSFVAK